MPNPVDIETQFIPDLILVAQKIGKTPTINEYTQHGLYNGRAAANKVGSWNILINRSGLPPIIRKERYSKKDLLEDLTPIVLKLGRACKQQEYKKLGGKYAYKLFCQKFASMPDKEDGWALANNLILEKLQISKENVLNRDEILNLVKKITFDLSRVPTRDEFLDTYPQITRKLIFDYWGDFNKLLIEADLPVNQHHKLTREEVIFWIKKLTEILGRIPAKKDLDEGNQVPFTSKPLYRLFGSIGAALEASGFEIPNSKFTPNEKMFQNIEEVTKIVKHSPTIEDIETHGNFHPTTLMKRTGKTWNQILISLGYSPHLGRGLPCVAEDEEIYESIGEAVVANTLLEARESSTISEYKTKIQICPDRKWTCDFIIQMDSETIFIEYDGFAGHKRPLQSYLDPDNPKIIEYKNKNSKLWIISPKKYISSYGEVLLLNELREKLKIPPKAKYLDIRVLDDLMCHQKIIREIKEIVEPREPLPNLDNCAVKEITRQEAKTIILEYEWLGKMGTATKAYYGLFSPMQELMGVVCFGEPPNPNVHNIFKDPDSKLTCLQRGTCTHWSPKNSASFLISQAVKQAHTKYGWNIFIAYSDELAKEIGTVYQACNWHYLGQGVGRKSKFRYDFILPNGKTVRSRYLRNKGINTERAIKMGMMPIRQPAKHLYIHFEGDYVIKEKLKKSCKYPFQPYPKKILNQNINGEIYDSM